MCGSLWSEIQTGCVQLWQGGMYDFCHIVLLKYCIFNWILRACGFPKFKQKMYVHVCMYVLWMCALHGRVTGTKRSLFELNVYIKLLNSKEIQRDFTEFQRNNMKHYLNTRAETCNKANIYIILEVSLPCRKNRNSGRKIFMDKGW